MFIGRSTWLIIEVFTRSILLLSRNWAISFRISSGKMPTYTLSTAFRTFSPPGMERYDRERDRDKASFEVRGWTTLMWQGVLDNLFPWAFVSITETLRFFFLWVRAFFLRCKGKSSWKTTEIKSRWAVFRLMLVHFGSPTLPWFFPKFCAGSQVNQDL